MTSSNGHTARSTAQGSAAGSTPVTDWSAAPTRRPGKGKAMLAQTPSWRPAVAPSVLDSRWLSQRSMPRVGTLTTSAANGSSRGSLTTAASASTRRSARSARWTISTASSLPPPARPCHRCETAAMDIHIEPSADAASAYTAARIVRRLNDAVDRRGAASIAFSGGSTPRAMLALLAGTGLPWKSITAYQVDERVAPDGDPDRNAGMLDVLPLPKRNLKLMPVTTTNHAAACRRYAASLPDRFDVVHLGLGDDGHTASWPPGDPVVAVTDPVAMCGMFNGRVRMTLTPAV